MRDAVGPEGFLPVGASVSPDEVNMSKQSIVMDQATFKNVVKRQHKALQQKGNAPSLMELQQSLAKALGFKDLHAAQKA